MTTRPLGLLARGQGCCVRCVSSSPPSGRCSKARRGRARAAPSPSRGRPARRQTRLASRPRGARRAGPSSAESPSGAAAGWRGASRRTWRRRLRTPTGPATARRSSAEACSVRPAPARSTCARARGPWIGSPPSAPHMRMRTLPSLRPSPWARFQPMRRRPCSQPKRLIQASCPRSERAGARKRAATSRGSPRATGSPSPRGLPRPPPRAAAPAVHGAPRDPNHRRRWQQRSATALLLRAGTPAAAAGSDPPPSPGKTPRAWHRCTSEAAAAARRRL